MNSEMFFQKIPKWLLAAALIFWMVQASHAKMTKPAESGRSPAGVRPESPFPTGIPAVPDVIVARMREGVQATSRSLGGTASLKKISAVEAGPFFKRRALNPGPLDYILKIRLAPGTDVFAAAAEMAASPDVLWAEPLYMHRICHTPDDPQVNSQWYLDQVQAFSAWDEFLKKFPQGRNAEVVIAVVDNGVSLSHPDLAAVIWSNAGERPGDGLDNDGNGYVDDVNGWDFADDDNNINPDPQSSNGDKWHGTGVAGI
ncbi:S8 family serine peptidase, partial [bacterium]|nr:S8 family serine peptidase [bacterium]